MTTRKPWIVLLIALFGTACLSRPTATEAPVVVESTGTFVVPTSTPDCLHTAGVTLEVRPISDTGVTVLISGLQPGEVPYITFYASNDSNGQGGTSGIFVTGANAQGEFSTDLGLLPPEGQSGATWDIRVIHSRGVECATITLP